MSLYTTGYADGFNGDYDFRLEGANIYYVEGFIQGSFAHYHSHQNDAWYQGYKDSFLNIALQKTNHEIDVDLVSYNAGYQTGLLETALFNKAEANQSETLLVFLEWLDTRQDCTINKNVAMNLFKQFCEWNNLPEVRAGYRNRLSEPIDKPLNHNQIVNLFEWLFSLGIRTENLGRSEN
jgi:hypothetical protein